MTCLDWAQSVVGVGSGSEAPVGAWRGLWAVQGGGGVFPVHLIKHLGEGFVSDGGGGQEDQGNCLDSAANYSDAKYRTENAKRWPHALIRLALWPEPGNLNLTPIHRRRSVASEKEYNQNDVRGGGFAGFNFKFESYQFGSLGMFWMSRYNFLM